MAIGFNGTSGQVDWGDVGALDGLNKLTISALISVNTGQAAFEYLIEKAEESPPNGWALLSGAANTTAGIFARDATNGGFGQVASAITLNTFMHWLYVYDGTQSTDATKLKLYLNGAAQTLSFTGSVPATMVAHAQTFRYAGNKNTAGQATCSLAEVGIWPGVAISDPAIISQLTVKCPLYFKALGLTFHDHGVRGAQDMLGLAAPTITGTTVVAHPRVRMLDRPRVAFSGTAVSRGRLVGRPPVTTLVAGGLVG